MPRKRQAKARRVAGTRTSGKRAEERIAEWKRRPKKFHPVFDRFGAVTGILDLSGLGLKEVPETLRAVRDLAVLDLNGNQIRALPRDTRVLNPGWVTGGVYAVIRAPSVAERDGQLVVSDMPCVLREAEAHKVLKATDYPPETHQHVSSSAPTS
jgi:hypothetical protein